MGGNSSEHEISLLSGREVVKALRNNLGFEVYPVVIPQKELTWRSLVKLQKGIDVVFIAMHGPHGEDGTIQGMLELARIPYTGSGVLASALGMNKLLFRKLMASQNIPIPKYISLTPEDKYTKKSFENELGVGPYVVKPHDQGSSMGVSLVEKFSGLNKAIKLAFRHSETILVDEYIEGIEITCGIIGNKLPQLLPLVEIRPKNKFFDYESKYNSSQTREIVPARISEKITRKIQDLAMQVYKLVGCRGFARIDFLLRGDQAYVLEINTIPGLTRMSLFPKAARAAGLDYPQLAEKIINLALDHLLDTR